MDSRATDGFAPSRWGQGCAQHFRHVADRTPHQVLSDAQDFESPGESMFEKSPSLVYTATFDRIE